jgi:hypothetical protein
MGIIVDPNPATEGQPVTITVEGSGPYEWSVFGDEWQPLTIDPETRQARITLPPGSGGGVLVVSDNRGPGSDTSSIPINSSD